MRNDNDTQGNITEYVAEAIDKAIFVAKHAEYGLTNLASTTSEALHKATPAAIDAAYAVTDSVGGALAYSNNSLRNAASVVSNTIDTVVEATPAIVDTAYVVSDSVIGAFTYVNNVTNQAKEWIWGKDEVKSNASAEDVINEFALLDSVEDKQQPSQPSSMANHNSIKALDDQYEALTRP